MKEHKALPFIGAFLGALLAAPAAAQPADFPNQPVRMMLTLSAGGALDALGRMIAEPLSANIGEAVIVENRPGAGGNLAAMHVARSAPDGYTLLYTTDSVVLNPLLFDNAGYTMDDLVPVASGGKGAQVLSTYAGSPYQTLDDLVQAAKAEPGAIAYGTPGAGQPSHLIGETFASLAGIELIHAPYKGGSLAVNDAIGGQIPLVISSLVAAAPHYESGHLRPLAMSGANRSDFLPDIPTFAELGYPDLVAENWNEFFAPAGTPDDVVEYLAEQITEVVESEKFQQTLDRIAFTTDGLVGHDAFVALVAETRKDLEAKVPEMDIEMN